MRSASRAAHAAVTAAKINLWGKSGGFCCPAPPGAAEFPSVARWVQPRSFWV